MHRVQALLDGAAAPRVITAPSAPHPVPVAADRQVLVRSLAEQLVSEANAVLHDHGDVMSLDDEAGPGGLSFTLGYRDHSARVQTTVSGRSAEACLVIDGQAGQQPHMLSGENELQALVLSLIAASRQH
jgi:hypothetical protein